MLPLIHNFFSIPKISGKQKGSCTKLFVSVIWDKKFRQNRDAPLLLCMKIFDKRIFLKHQSVLQWNISVQWNKIFRREILIPPPLIQTFSIPEIIATVKDSTTEIFGTLRQKIFDGKSWYSPPPSYPNFFDTRNYCNSKGFHYGNFRHFETKNFRRKILILPPPPSYPNFFDTRNYCNSKGFHYGSFRHFDGTFSTENLDTPLPLNQTFSIPEIIEILKDSPLRKFSALWDKKFSIKNFETPPPPLSINFFATGNSLKHSTEGFTYQIFRHWETKKIRQKIENCDITLWCINFFTTRNFLIHRSVPQRKFLVLWGKKFWTKSRV